jgi:hypothetical protein
VVVTVEAYPFGVRCGMCGREIPVGSRFRWRDASPPYALSTGPDVEVRADMPVHVNC